MTDAGNSAADTHQFIAPNDSTRERLDRFLATRLPQISHSRISAVIRDQGATVDGQRITFMRATGRHFAKILSGLLLLIGYLMVLWTARKQGLHDMMAKCLVVRHNAVFAAPETS